VHDPSGAHLSNGHRWRLEALGHAASRGADRPEAEEGANVGAVVDGYGGGDVARWGEVSGAPMAASMKGPWRLH
jgi:hypothetical protein